MTVQIVIGATLGGILASVILTNIWLSMIYFELRRQKP